MKKILNIDKKLKKYEFKNYKKNKTYENIKNKKIYDIKYYDMKLRLNKNMKYNNLSIVNYKTNIINYYVK